MVRRERFGFRPLYIGDEEDDDLDVHVSCIEAVLQPLMQEGQGKRALDFDVSSQSELKKRLLAFNKKASEVVFGNKRRPANFEKKQ